MNKVTLAALTVATLTATSILPVLAQSINMVPCIRGQCERQNPAEENCGTQVGHLTRVYPAEVAGISDRHRIWITEICAETSVMRADGNAAYLRPTIAANEVIADALQSRSFTANNVFAVKMMGEDTINLYVHHFREE